jgi:hypothetical protein
VSGINGRLKHLEALLRASGPASTEPSPKEELQSKLAEIAERRGPTDPEDKPDSEEVLAEVRARVSVLTGGGGGR